MTGHGDRDHVEATAVLSIVFQLAIVVVASGRVWFWRRILPRGLKFLFHAVLLATSLLELPLWILTAAGNHHDGGGYPENRFFPFVYACHLLALPGYFGCIGIIVILWRDLLESTRFSKTFVNKEGWIKDRVRVFFFFFSVLYLAVEISVAISVLVKMNWRARNVFFETNIMYHISILFDPAMLLVFTSAFIYYGVKIQCHVMRVKLNENVHMRVVCQLNFFVSVITVCYLLRAFVVTGLLFQGKGMWRGAAKYHQWDENIPFIYYVMLTQWLPCNLTSYCLLYLMRKPPNAQALPPPQPTSHQPQSPSQKKQVSAEDIEVTPYFGFDDSGFVDSFSSHFDDSRTSSHFQSSGTFTTGEQGRSYTSAFSLSGKSTSSSASYTSSVGGLDNRSLDVFGVSDLNEELLPTEY
jgi:hypothetical protein